MSAAPETVTAPVTEACPPWCTGHLASDGSTTVHVREVTVGNMTVTCEWAPTCTVTNGEQLVDVRDVDWASGQDARDLAAAIVQACDLIEGDRASARIARRVSAILTAEPIDADQLEAIAAALGVHWHDLVRPDDDSAAT